MESTKPKRKIHRFLSLIALFVVMFSNFAAEGQNLKTTRNKNYTKPIYFDVFGTLSEPPPVEIEWDLGGQQGQSLQIGPVTIDEKTLSFGHRRLQDVDPKFPGVASETSYLFVNWPEFLFPEARIEILTRDGSVIWKRDVLKADFEQWQKIIEPAIKANKRSPLGAIEWGIDSSKAGLPFEGLADEFRFCLSRFREESQERLCSQRYLIRKVGSQTLLGRVKTVGKARVLINGESAALKGKQLVQGEMPTRFFAELATGETFDFTSKPFSPKWADFVRVDGTPMARLVGHDVPPIGRYQIVNQEKFPNWVEQFGFEPTIGDSRKFWAIAIKESEPWVYFPGAEGGVFRHSVPVDKAPSSKLRPYLHRNTPKGTYKDGMVVRGRKQPTSTVTSEERKIFDSNESTQFRWSFKANQDAKINRSSFLLTDGDKNYTAYYELYKGFANELSGRSSMVISDQGLILMGEVSYNHWFEDMWGWDDYYLTKQRWGVSGRYFQSFTKFKTGDLGNTKLQVMNVDLKYRFTPGLWTRDETHGVMVSYQNAEVDVDVTKFTVPMLGVGWFWARSMPRLFDDIISQLPFMNYPKWVDMEFIYYGMSMDSRNQLDVNFALNFHGQVLWTDSFFGEAGFGIKTYAFTDKENPYQANLGYELNTLYGTVGIGFKF